MPTDFSHLYTTLQSGQVSAPPAQESAENANEAPTTPVSWHQLLHSWIHPVETEQAVEQGFQQHEEQVRQEADAKNQLYYTDPVKYKEQYPISFYARKLHDVAAQALMDPALRNMSPALTQKLEPDIHALVDTGLGAYGVPSGEEPTSDIKQGVVAPEPLDFSEVEGLQTIKPAPEYLYHATDVSRVPAIEKEGLRAGTWFANTPEEALRSGAVPVSGNRADLRVFRVPRSEFLKGTPAAEDIGARGAEEGKFKVSGAPMKAELVDHLKHAVESAGGVFRGAKSGLVEITLPRSMTDKLNMPDNMKNYVSVTLPEAEVTPEKVRAAMEKKFTEFGGRPSTEK